MVPLVAVSFDLHFVQRLEKGSLPGQELVFPHFLQVKPFAHFRLAKNSKHFSSLWNISSSCSGLNPSLKILLIINYFGVQRYKKIVILKRFKCYYSDLL